MEDNQKPMKSQRKNGFGCKLEFGYIVFEV